MREKPGEVKLELADLNRTIERNRTVSKRMDTDKDRKPVNIIQNRPVRNVSNRRVREAQDRPARDIQLPVRKVRNHPSGSRTGRKRARKQRRRRLIRNFLVSVIIIILSILALYFFFFYNNETASERREKAQVQAANMDTPTAAHPEWTEDFLTLNEYSRPGTPLTQVKNIFIHYTANPGTNAAQNRSYFEQLKDTRERSASAHFIIGYEGEIIQCIPLNEIAYAVVERNEDSISIECCYTNEDGSFSEETYDSLVSLLKWMMEAYKLDAADVLRHYDSGGKKCPLYYVENEAAWERLKQDIEII